MLLFCTTFNTVYSQITESPNRNGEFCPNTEYTFTASLPKAYASMIGNGGCYVTQPPASNSGLTITFKCKFGDSNQKQWFKVNYQDYTSDEIPFTKIKSLFYSTVSTANPSCNVIKPNQTQPLVFPRCQVSSATISFPNIQWFTNFEIPEICFGTVTDYEYLLPANWSIGGLTSNGSNWIPGGNSVVVTSDLSTGDGADIKIRASNRSCGAGLAANGPVSLVRITRPRPTLSFVGDDILCSGTKTYSISGTLPPGATVCWSSSNVNYASVPTANCGTSIPLSFVSKGSVTLTATVSDCIETYTITSNPILVGATVTGYYFINSNYHQPFQNPLYETNSAIWLPANENFGVTVYITSPGLLSKSWTIAPNSYPFGWGNYSNLVFSGTSGTSPYAQRNGVFTVSAQTACGAYTGTYTWPVIVRSWAPILKVSPNPASGNINIRIDNVLDTSSRDLVTIDNSNKNSEVNIAVSNKTKFLLYDVNTNILVKQWTYAERDSKNYSLNIAGLKSGYYILKMERDNKIVTEKIFVQ